MKKLTVLALVYALALGACQFISAPTNSAPTVDVAGTVNSIAQTAVAQTFAAQPSPTATLVPDTSTPPVAAASATSSPLPTPTDTPQANLTATIATATTGPEVIASTPTAAPSSPSLTPTLGILTYGTLPPAIVPYIGITLVNKSERQAYISLQVVTKKGGPTIIEYPVKKVVKEIPVGSYTYVVWVGGRQIVGYFTVSRNDEPTITIYKDKVVVN